MIAASEWNVLVLSALGFGIWLLIALVVLACGKAAARADQEWDELIDEESGT